jgi:hypothetical protein
LPMKERYRLMSAPRLLTGIPELHHHTYGLKP